jgi:hypothetical protein
VSELTSSGGSLGWPGRIAVAIVRGDPPVVFLARSDSVLGRMVALRVVARTSPDDLQSSGLLAEIRSALLEERWGDAVALWMQATGEIVDAYPDEEIWTDDDLSDERAVMEIRVARIFEGTRPPPDT